MTTKLEICSTEVTVADAVANGLSDLEALRDEIEAFCDELENLIDSAESVEFPGMYG